jgi:hypothetical protein
MKASVAAPPADLDAYLAERYPWATKLFGNGTLLYGSSLYKHTFRYEGLTAGDVAAACRFTRAEGSPAQQWRLTSALFGAGGFGFDAAFNRIVNCAEVEAARPGGPHSLRPVLRHERGRRRLPPGLRGRHVRHLPAARHSARRLCRRRDAGGAPAAPARGRRGAGRARRERAARVRPEVCGRRLLRLCGG